MIMNYNYSATFIISTVMMDRLKESTVISDRMKALIRKPVLEELSLDRQFILFRIAGDVDQSVLDIREDWSIHGELSDLIDEIISIQQSLRTRPKYSITIHVRSSKTAREPITDFKIRRGPRTTSKDFKFSKALMDAIN